MIKYIIVGLIGYGIAAAHYDRGGCQIQGINVQEPVMEMHSENPERTKDAARYPGLLEPPGRTQATGLPVPLK